MPVGVGPSQRCLSLRREQRDPALFGWAYRTEHRVYMGSSPATLDEPQQFGGRQWSYLPMSSELRAACPTDLARWSLPVVFLLCA